MPEVIDEFRHLEEMDQPSLHARYQEIISGLKRLPNGQPDPTAVQDDDKLREMCAILANLRRRAAGPPKVKKVPGTSSKKSPIIAPTIDQL